MDRQELVGLSAEYLQLCGQMSASEQRLIGIAEALFGNGNAFDKYDTEESIAILEEAFEQSGISRDDPLYQVMHSEFKQIAVEQAAPFN